MFISTRARGKCLQSTVIECAVAFFLAFLSTKLLARVFINPACSAKQRELFLKECFSSAVGFIYNFMYLFIWLRRGIQSLGRKKIPWRRKWQLTPVFLPGESHGQRSLAGCSPWGHKLDVFVVQSLSCFWLFVTPWTAAQQTSLPSPSPRACSDSCLLSQWRHQTISSFVISFSTCLQSFSVSGSFLMSWLK